MEDNYMDILTPVQAKYHLMNGEVICFDFKDGSCYFTLFEDDKVLVQFIRRFGSSDDMIGDFDTFEKTVELLCMGSNLYIYKGATIENRKLTIFDRLADWIRGIKA